MKQSFHFYFVQLNWRLKLTTSRNTVEISGSSLRYRLALCSKLVEVAQEVKDAGLDDFINELADLQEVMTALMSAYSISQEQVREAQDARRNVHGGFEKRLKLLWSG